MQTNNNSKSVPILTVISFLVSIIHGVSATYMTNQLAIFDPLSGTEFWQSTVYASDWSRGIPSTLTFTAPGQSQFQFGRIVDATTHLPPPSPVPPPSWTVPPTRTWINAFGEEVKSHNSGAVVDIKFGANSWVRPYLTRFGNGCEEAWDHVFGINGNLAVNPANNRMVPEYLTAQGGYNNFIVFNFLHHQEVNSRINKSMLIAPAGNAENFGTEVIWDLGPSPGYIIAGMVNQNASTTVTHAGVTVGSTNSVAGPTTVLVEMPPMTIVHIWGEAPVLNLAPQAGVAAGGHYLESAAPPAKVKVGASSAPNYGIVFTYPTFGSEDGIEPWPQGVPQPGQFGEFGEESQDGERPIVWYGTFANDLNAAGVRNLRNPLDLNQYNTTPSPGAVQIGEIITYEVVETRPPAPTAQTDLWHYCFQVGASLGNQLRVTPVYSP